MSKTSVIVVDDKGIIRDAITLLFTQSKSINIVAEAATGKDAIDLIKRNNYDVVLMDINMPNMNGIEACKKIKAINPSIKILSNSCHVESYYIIEMLRAGAHGFIKKGDSLATYEEAIWTVVNGGIHLSDEINSETYKEVFASLQCSTH